MKEVLRQTSPPEAPYSATRPISGGDRLFTIPSGFTFHPQHEAMYNAQLSERTRAFQAQWADAPADEWEAPNTAGELMDDIDFARELDEMVEDRHQS